jgi:hypothetical protein
MGKGLWSNAIAGFMAAVVLCAALIVTIALGIVFRLGAQLAALFLTTLEEVRHANQDALNAAIGAGMTDLLSVPIDGSDIPSGGDPAAQLERAKVIGQKLHTLLTTEFGGDNGPDGVNGTQAARAFTGFNINFNTSAAILSVLTEIASVGYIKEFREVGEMLAQGLSLGRLHRQALKPLIDSLIVHPYTRELGSKYRQARLSAQQYTDASEGGNLGSEQWHTNLAEMGYTDDDISILHDALRKNHSPADLNALIRYGLMTDDQAQTILRVQALGRVDTLQDAYVSEAYNLAKNRHMSESEFQQTMDSTKLTEEEKQLWAQRLSLHLLHPQKRISILQLLYLGEHSQITDAEVDAWVEAEGYDADDAALIHLYVLGKELDFDTAQATKAAKAAAVAARAAATAAGKTAKAAAAADLALAKAAPTELSGLQAQAAAAHAADQQAQQLAATLKAEADRLAALIPKRQ